MSEYAGIIREKFEGIKDAVLDYFDSRNMEASGQFRQNLLIEQEITGSRIVTRLISVKYIEQLAFGRRPGTAPPQSAIRDWIENKPSAQAAFEWATLKEYQKRGIVFVISRKMKEEGSVYFREGGTDILEATTQQALDVVFDEIIVYFTEYFTRSFVTEYRNTWGLN
jgi:hypothetical protein